MKIWRVDDVMTRDVVTADRDDSVEAMVERMVRRRVGALPVVNRFGHVLGVVSQTDLLTRLQAPRRRSGGLLHRWPSRCGRTAGELMTAPPVPVRKSLSIEAAARRMTAARVDRLLVEDDLGRLAGIVTRGDLLRAVAGTDSARPPLSAVA